MRDGIGRIGAETRLGLLRQVLPASMNMLTIIIGSFVSIALVGRFGSEPVAGYAVGLATSEGGVRPETGKQAVVRLYDHLARMREAAHSD